MSTCRNCFFCTPNYKGGISYFKVGVCYHAQRRVLADMTACALFQERTKNVALKSTPEKRNKYKDKDGNSIVGMTLPEVLDKPLTILAKREYTWGNYTGMAVKVKGPNGKLAIVEITAETPIKALNMPKMPKMPYKAMFIQKWSKRKFKYYTVEVIDNGGDSRSG